MWCTLVVRPPFFLFWKAVYICLIKAALRESSSLKSSWVTEVLVLKTFAASIFGCLFLTVTNSLCIWEASVEVLELSSDNSGGSELELSSFPRSNLLVIFFFLSFLSPTFFVLSDFSVLLLSFKAVGNVGSVTVVSGFSITFEFVFWVEMFVLTSFALFFIRHGLRSPSA